MSKNYICRTITEAMERIKQEHGPAATIVRMWEFQRRNEDGALEGWVGVMVDPDANSDSGSQHEAPPEPAKVSASPQVKGFTELREKWKDAGSAARENGTLANRQLQKYQKPITPTSPTQSQVMKARFREAEPSAQQTQPLNDLLTISSTSTPTSEPRHPYSKIGGLEKELATLREMVEYPLCFPEMFQKVGIEAPKGVLLCGPPGSGKTLLARAIADATSAHFKVINGPELVGSYQGESERNLRTVFEEAEKKAPSILFFDEIDAIAPKREDASGPEKRLVTQLLTLMDGLESRGQVIVIASTNTPNDIDPALRRPGRLDRELCFTVPKKKARKKILEVHTQRMALGDEVDLDWLAESTHGFVGADLAAMCREAGLCAIREVMPQVELVATESSAKIPVLKSGNGRPGNGLHGIDPSASSVYSAIPEELLSNLCIRKGHFEAALNEAKPASLRNQKVNLPKVRWTEIGGLDQVKAALEEAVIWPLRHTKLFEQADVQPPRGILLAGPPGTGKTMLAKALATESGVNFISIKGPSLVSKYVGESEKGIRDIFQQARQAAPCILFFDEIDAVAPSRGADASAGAFADRLVAQLLVEMDGIEKLDQVLVLGATNRPDAIDPALRRPGRFDRVVQIPLPDEASRLEILRVHTARKPLDGEIDLGPYASHTEGFSGADLESVCRLAALAAVRRAVIAPKSPDTGKNGTRQTPRLASISAADFEAAIEEVRKQVQRRLVEKTATRAIIEKAVARIPDDPPLPDPFLDKEEQDQESRVGV